MTSPGCGDFRDFTIFVFGGVDAFWRLRNVRLCFFPVRWAMGYCTRFDGEIKIKPKLLPHHLKYLRRFVGNVGPLCFGQGSALRSAASCCIVLFCFGLLVFSESCFSGSRRVSYYTRAEFPDRVSDEGAPTVIDDVKDPLRVACGLPVGERGAFFVGTKENSGFEPFLLCDNSPPGAFTEFDRRKDFLAIDALPAGQERDEAFRRYWQQRPKVDLFPPHERQPSLNVISFRNASTMVFPDFEQKTYGYALWIRYMIRHFFAPWNYELSGSVSWQGEDETDFGTMTV